MTIAACLLAMLVSLDGASSLAFLRHENPQPGSPVCQSDCLGNEQGAHMGAMREYLAKAVSERREYGWHVYRMPDGTYSYSWPSLGQVGADTGLTPPVSTKWEVVSSGHVHWNDRPYFSGLDWKWVAANKRPLYLGNTLGEIRVLPVRKVLSIRRNGNRAHVYPDSSYRGQLVASNLPLPSEGAIPVRGMMKEKKNPAASAGL